MSLPIEEEIDPIVLMNRMDQYAQVGLPAGFTPELINKVGMLNALPRIVQSHQVRIGTWAGICRMMEGGQFEQETLQVFASVCSDFERVYGHCLQRLREEVSYSDRTSEEGKEYLGKYVGITQSDSQSLLLNLAIGLGLNSILTRQNFPLLRGLSEDELTRLHNFAARNGSDLDKNLQNGNKQTGFPLKNGSNSNT